MTNTMPLEIVNYLPLRREAGERGGVRWRVNLAASVLKVAPRLGPLPAPQSRGEEDRIYAVYEGARGLFKSAS